MKSKKTKCNNLPKGLWMIALCSMSFLAIQAQVVLSTDFTSADDKNAPLHNVWSVANRISPKNGSNVRPDLKVNLVRMIGGINKKVNGENVPDLDFDPCRYDSTANTYVYNWDPLISRLNKIVNSEVGIHQIVLDQPPWAFQHGYIFIPTGTTDNIHFREDERMTTYGNSLPPYDKEAYFNFIVALMTKLIDTYGEEKVRSWRFRVGSEIETPDHWKGTKQDFIDHYANTVRAILSVLPNAVVGPHTRQPGFIYKNGEVKNYKGEVIASFAADLIDYCYENDDVRYDFWGISDYILINNKDVRDITVKYNDDFAPLINHAKWNSDATIEYHEYNVVTTMNAPDGGTLSCVTSHDQTYQVALSQLFYEKKSKGLNEIFRWGQRPSSTEEISVELVNTMLGKTRYSHTITGSPIINSHNLINATFAKDDNTHQYDVLAYNYNANSLDYKASEPVTLSFVTDLPVGTQLFYRDITYGEAQNDLQMFMKGEPSSGWIKSGYDWKGDPSRTLNDSGQAAWSVFVNPNKTEWSIWKSITTEAPASGTGSVINIATKLSSFSFQKFEIKDVKALSTAIAPAQSKVQFTSSDDFRQFQPYTGGTGSYKTITIENDTMQLVLNNNYPRFTIKPDIDYKSYDKFRIVIKNGSSSSIFNVKWKSDGVDKSLTYRNIVSTNDTEFHSYTFDVGAHADWKGEITDVQLWGPNQAIDGVVVIDTMEFFASNPTIDNVSIETTEGGFVNYTSGKCLRGQEIELVATPLDGYEFVGWTGDVSSDENPLFLTITEDLEIEAVFEEKSSSIEENYSLGIRIFPNPSYGEFTITSAKDGLAIYRLLNIAGKEMSKGEFFQHKTINTDAFQAGVYLLEVYSEGVCLVEKMICKQ